jgi:hypothetical protein
MIPSYPPHADLSQACLDHDLMHGAGIFLRGWYRIENIDPVLFAQKSKEFIEIPSVEPIIASLLSGRWQCGATIGIHVGSSGCWVVLSMAIRSLIATENGDLTPGMESSQLQSAMRSLNDIHDAIGLSCDVGIQQMLTSVGLGSILANHRMTWIIASPSAQEVIHPVCTGVQDGAFTRVIEHSLRTYAIQHFPLHGNTVRHLVTASMVIVGSLSDETMMAICGWIRDIANTACGFPHRQEPVFELCSNHKNKDGIDCMAIGIAFEHIHNERDPEYVESIMKHIAGFGGMAIEGIAHVTGSLPVLKEWSTSHQVLIFPDTMAGAHVAGRVHSY